jgi:predicted amidophosphoribosyltransferase
MATVAELSGPYANFMLTPLAPGTADVCSVCLTFTEGHGTCYPCGRNARFADAVLPISYSVHFGQLHTALAQYKRRVGPVARRFQIELAAVLWRFLTTHEGCLARRAGASGFDLVTTVPSSDPQRDPSHPLRDIVGTIVGPTRDRYAPLLARSGTPVPARTVDPGKYNPTRDLDGESVLLIDDTWASGANAQCAAGGLKSGGAGPVGVLVIGRHIQESYRNNATRLRGVSRTFSWEICALHEVGP